MKAKRVTKRANFVSPNEKAKSAVVAQLVRIARKARLGYDDFLYISQQARKKLGLRRGRKERRLPQLLADADLKRFFRLPVILTIVRQSWNEFMTNPFYPGIVTLMLGV